MSTQVVIEGAEDVVKALKKLGLDTARSQEIILKAGAEVVKRRAADNVRGASVKVADGIKIAELPRQNQAVSVGVGPTDKQWWAVFIERGVRPHKITASSAKALRFVGTTGEFIYRRGVQHPGVKARPFMAPAADQSHGEIVDAMAAKAETIILKVSVK